MVLRWQKRVSAVSLIDPFVQNCSTVSTSRSRSGWGSSSMAATAWLCNPGRNGPSRSWAMQGHTSASVERPGFSSPVCRAIARASSMALGTF